MKTNVLKEYKSFNIEEIVYLFYFYNPKRSIGKYFFLIVDCYLKFLQKYNREVFCTKGDFEGMLLNLFSKNLSLRNVISGTQYQLRLCKVEDLKNKQITEMGYKNKEISQQIESIQIFIKPNLSNINIKENIYEIETNEIKLIYKTSKIYELKSKRFLSIISVHFHKVINYYEIHMFFPHSCRNFTTNIHISDIAKIPKDAYVFLEENPDCKESDIWKHYLKHSKIVNNKEGNGFFEFHNISVLMKEKIYSGFDLKNGNNIIYIEIFLKSSFKMLVSDIDHVLSKIDVGYSNFILQVFSFEKNSWYKEVFLVKEIQELYLESSNLIEQKYLNYSSILKIGKLVAKNSNMNKMQFDIIENTGLSDVGMKNLISKLKTDKPKFEKVKELYDKRINLSIESNKYTETIWTNPCIIAKVYFNYVKQCVIINFYVAKTSKTSQISVPIEEIKQVFFPFFNEIVNNFSKILALRILNHYKTLFINSPGFIKLLK